MYNNVQVVPGRAGGGSFRRKKKYIAKKEFAYRMCARRPTSAMPKPIVFQILHLPRKITHEWSLSQMKRPVQCAEQQTSNFTKYCACHEKSISWLILLSHETSFTMRGARRATLQLHQIRLPPRISEFKISAESPWIASANIMTIRAQLHVEYAYTHICRLFYILVQISIGPYCIMNSPLKSMIYVDLNDISTCVSLDVLRGLCGVVSKIHGGIAILWGHTWSPRQAFAMPSWALAHNELVVAWKTQSESVQLCATNMDILVSDNLVTAKKDLDIYEWKLTNSLQHSSLGKRRWRISSRCAEACSLEHIGRMFGW